MKKIIVIHTGGTIAMKENKETRTVSLQDSNPLRAFDNILSSEVTLLTEQLFNIPSPHMTPSHMTELYHYMNKRLDETNANGVVITHGTDTLEETAYTLDFLNKRETPIVITGAMRASSELQSDGPHNFISSIRTAVDDKSKGKGVLVVMNDEIHTARDVIKTNTANVASFVSPNTGPLGRIQHKSIKYFNQPIKQTKVDNVFNMDKNVLLLKMFSGFEEQTFQHIISLPIDGLVIEAMGAGNVPPSVLDGIQSLIEHDIPVVLTSRCVSGAVQDIYNYKGGGYTLKEAGVIFAGDLHGVKARLKLMAALESSTAMKDIKHLFEVN